MSDQEKDGLQFDQAEFAAGAAGAPSACALCNQPLSGSYWTLNGHPSCESCQAGFAARFTGGSGLARLLKSLIFGALAGLLGAALYYGVSKITGYELSLIAMATGWLVGKGVSLGNEHRGGRLYQVLAVLLTWSAISASYVPFMDEAMREGSPAAVSPAENEAAEATDSAAVTAGDAADDGFDFFSLPTPVRWAIQFPLAFALPFLAITESPMMIVILFFGLWVAWSSNKKVELHVSGPHALAPAPPPPGSGPIVEHDPQPPSA